MIPINVALTNKCYDIAKLIMEHPLFDMKHIETSANFAYKEFTRNYQQLCASYQLYNSPKSRAEFDNMLNVLTENYTQAISTLMDNATGTDFQSLEFLKNMDVSKMNFLGISVDGTPITHAVLKKWNLQGAEKAITTIDELKSENLPRRATLQAGLDRAFKKRGHVVDNTSGLVILAPLWKAVRNGDITTVKARLEWKEENPNIGADLQKYRSDEAIPLLIAIKNKREDIVECLLKHPLFDPAWLDKAVNYAKKVGY